MRRGQLSLLCALAFALTSAADAQDEYTPPPLGTMVTWSFGSEGGRETRLSEVVATGPDYAIFQSDLRLSADNPAAYFVEFSGIHITSCAADMPSREQRDRLASAWPLESGDTIEVAGDQLAVYTIGELMNHTLNIAEGPTEARQVKVDYGDIENDIMLSLAWNMAVAVQWPDGTGDRALEIVPPAKSPAPRSDLMRVIGNCAGLLAN